MRILALLLLFFGAHLQASKIGYLEVPRDRPIDQSTALYVKFALEEYRKQEVSAVLLHLNTPGGEVFAATTIAEALVELDRVHKIPVVAVIDNWALSAGAMLAYSCRYIAVSPQGLMGAAEPVMQGSSGQMESAPEKINSALRAEMATLAKAYDRNPWVAQAMVDKDLIVAKRGNEIVRLNEMSQLKKSDQLISREGKLLTLDAEQLLGLGIANFSLPHGQEPLTLPPFAELSSPTLVKYHSWKIQFFSILSHPMVASLLMMGLMAGIYLEIQNPGLIIPGVIGALCLGLMVLSQLASHAIAWLEAVFVITGILLLIAELWFFPGTFVCGILGALLFFGGMFALLLPSWQAAEFSWNFSQWNLAAIEFADKLQWLSISFLVSLVIVVLLGRYVGSTLFRKTTLVLKEDQEGSVAGLESKELPQVGQEGVVVTPLLPGGKAKFQDRTYDVLSHSEFIEKGEKVIVSETRGSVIVCKRKPNE